MTLLLERLGRKGIEQLQGLGHAGLFLLRTLVCPPPWRELGPAVMRQLYFVGVLSLLIIMVSGLFIGMVIALQGYHTLRRFSAESQLGSLVALSMVRELGPVVTALLFAGRAGSALTSEIGLMQSTEQVASMEMMAVDPIAYLIYPRLLAGFLAMPLLAFVFNMVAIYGGFLVVVQWLGLDAGLFWSNMQASVDFATDILNGSIKSVVFGTVVTWIAVYQGYYTLPTAQGISKAATRTVVYASVAVLGLDFVLTSFMLKGW